MAGVERGSRLEPAGRVFVGIDRPDRAGAASEIARLAGTGCAIKLGLEFFVANARKPYARSPATAGSSWT